MKYKGIIFDLDGVICFTDKYHYLAWKRLADKLGKILQRIFQSVRRRHRVFCWKF